MGILSFLRNDASNPGPNAPEPNLRPESLERFRRLSPAERRRVLKEAHESATRQVKDYGRDYQENYDAWLELELGGHFARMAEAARKVDRYTPPEETDAFMFGHTGDPAFLPPGWSGPRDDRDLALATSDPEYWAACYPAGTLTENVVRAYLLGVASKNEASAKQTL